ncbi:Glucose-dependent insulinotropic receptor [Liparis tanakae]|uniref:Glucose-dependent insulinotropic receptor n=1 Tax=Liparis tanakae TaxID=230148 RepID=A0A4Z2FKL9_9TELE|nr:Glucose-dependent insulinotropic receptor [Liparis tanakae]
MPKPNPLCTARPGAADTQPSLWRPSPLREDPGDQHTTASSSTDVHRHVLRSTGEYYTIYTTYGSTQLSKHTLCPISIPSHQGEHMQLSGHETEGHVTNELTAPRVIGGSLPIEPTESPGGTQAPSSEFKSTNQSSKKPRHTPRPLLDGMDVGGVNLQLYRHQALRPSDPQTLRPSEPQSLRPSDPQSLRPSDPQTLRPSDPQNLRPSEPQTLRPSDPHTLRPSDPQTLRPSDPQNLRPSEPQTLTPSHPQTLRPSPIGCFGHKVV